MHKRNRELVFNIVFWLFYFLYEWLGLAALTMEYSKYFVNACMAFPLSFIVSFLTVHLLIKKFYDKGEKLKFWAFQVAMSVGLLLLRRIINYYLIYPYYFPEAQHVPLFSFGKLIIEFVNLYLIVGVYALFYFVQSWYEERQRVQTLEQEKTIAELELLKSQVQPHFIFNALNNIYSSALRTSKQTPELISHLSHFLSYNLYDAKQSFVPLSSEISHIRHYIELQKNRYGDQLDVSINIYDEISDLCIAPLLLLPLVENSFKHGVARCVCESWIRIDVSRSREHFFIKIENSIEEEGSGNRPASGGIGIKNVMKRLDLIYPHAHEFKTSRQPNSYLVVLKLRDNV